jgi:RHS repeat-associated protein
VHKRRKNTQIPIAHDANGNQTEAGDTHYAYNLANELTQETKAGSEVSYTYSGDGLMLTRTASSAATNYAWDPSSDLQNLAIEGSKSYTYAEGPLGFVSGSDSFTYHTDSLGSVMELSGASGSSVESYRYSPYGEANSGGGDPEADSGLGNSLRYAGQYLDSETDLYDMRAREYDPGVGRFLEVDPVEAAVGDPSVGVYVYVDDRPTVEVDPSGMCAMAGSGGGASKKDFCNSLLVKVFKFAFRDKYNHGGRRSGVSGVEERYESFLKWGRKPSYNWKSHTEQFTGVQNKLHQAINDYIDNRCPPPSNRVPYALWRRAVRLSKTPAPTRAQVARYVYTHPFNYNNYNIWWVNAFESVYDWVKNETKATFGSEVPVFPVLL